MLQKTNVIIQFDVISNNNKYRRLRSAHPSELVKELPIEENNIIICGFEFRGIRISRINFNCSNENFKDFFTLSTTSGFIVSISYSYKFCGAMLTLLITTIKL